MAHHSRQEDRERLEREIDGEDYLGLLEAVRKSNPAAAIFGKWVDVIRFMHDTKRDGNAKDAILRAIFSAHRNDYDPRWRTLLLVIFWPGLEAIHWKKKHWDADPEDRWQNVVWTFLRVVCKIDPERRPCGLPRKVINDTVHHLWDDYRRVIERAKRELPMDEEMLVELAGGGDDQNDDGIDLELTRRAQVERLREHVSRGSISDADFLLLVGTRVYGEAVADYARRQGVGYQAVKKRRQRAEAAIRRSDEEVRMSPMAMREGPYHFRENA